MKKNIFVLVLALLLVSCCRQAVKSDQQDTGDKQKMEKAAPENRSNMAPGTANVKAVILENFTGDDFINLKIKVLEVMDYGAAFPPLPAGTEISVGMTKEVFDSANAVETVGINKNYTMVLQRISSPSGNDTWKVLQLMIYK